MGKKIKNQKLMVPKNAPKENKLSAFNSFANNLTAARKKKTEKIGDTKKRLMEAKKTNKMFKVSKRTTKFALLDD